MAMDRTKDKGPGPAAQQTIEQIAEPVGAGPSKTASAWAGYVKSVSGKDKGTAGGQKQAEPPNAAKIQDLAYKFVGRLKNAGPESDRVRAAMEDLCREAKTSEAHRAEVVRLLGAAGAAAAFDERIGKPKVDPPLWFAAMAVQLELPPEWGWHAPEGAAKPPAAGKQAAAAPV